MSKYTEVNRRFLISGTVTSLSLIALLVTGNAYRELEHDYKVLKNNYDAFQVNYERSAEDIHYTLEEQKLRIRNAEQEVEVVLESLNDAVMQIEEKDATIQGLTSEVNKLKEEAKTVAVSPSSFNQADIDLLYRLVEAEAGGESIRGRIAVANVVLNRIKSDKYPNTMGEVIYQRNQFEVVNIGTINTKTPSEGTVEAVNRALNGEKVVPDNVVMFWATYLDKGHEIWQHANIVTTIGIHHFSDGWY